MNEKQKTDQELQVLLIEFGFGDDYTSNYSKSQMRKMLRSLESQIRSEYDGMVKIPDEKTLEEKREKAGGDFYDEGYHLEAFRDGWNECVKMFRSLQSQGEREKDAVEQLDTKLSPVVKDFADKVFNAVSNLYEKAGYDHPHPPTQGEQMDFREFMDGLNKLSNKDNILTYDQATKIYDTFKITGLK
jgi:hypothetical protein